jgi:alpha-mannosidase
LVVNKEIRRKSPYFSVSYAGEDGSTLRRANSLTTKRVNVADSFMNDRSNLMSGVYDLMKLARGLALLVVLMGLCFTAGAQSDSTWSKVFQIGTFDRSSTEFHQEGPKKPVTFVVGQSDPAKDWYAGQAASPAEQPASGEITSAPRTIQFTLPNAPEAVYRLHIALVLGSRAVPAMRVNINEKRGIFYLQSKLNSTLGGMDDSFETAYVTADVSIDFSGTYLHKGLNSIALDVVRVDQPASLPVSLNYDAIELDSGTRHSGVSAAPAKILPTIFFQRNNDKLNEVVDVFVRHDQPAKSGDLDFVIGGAHYRKPFHTDYDFGEEKFDFAVPEFPAQTEARLAWTIDGKQSTMKQPVDPQKKWTIFLIPHTHLDIGYSDYQPKVAAIQSRAIDEAMDFTEHEPDFRYSVDGSWVLDQFIKMRSPADQQRLIVAMRKGQVSVPAEYANLLTGFPTAETLIRSLYTSANFSREHGTPFNYANITDVPSYSWSYASILASAGIKYFVGGPNGHETRAPVLLQGRLNEDSPYWWQGPDGKKVLSWYSRHYWQMGILFGVPPGIPAARETLPLLLQAYQRPSYRSDAVIVFGSQQENTDLFPQQATFAQSWNDLYAYPRMQYAGFYEALKNIATPFGNDIPTVRGDGGPYWEDGIASAAGLAAMERQNESRGPSVEQLATVNSLVSPLMGVDKQSLDRMWTNMVLMDEHTWTSHDSVSDPTSEESVRQSAVKEQYAVDASSIADFVARNSMANLADSISAGRDSLIVFNTLNWKRSGLVSFDLNHGDEIVDPSTGHAVSMETVHEGRALRGVNFLARDVPANGYKVFTLRRGPGVARTDVNQATVLENSYYRVTLDPATGSVRSIFDKEQQRKLVDEKSPYRFGQYLYVAGGDQRPNTLLQYRPVPLPPALQVTGAHGGRLVSTTRTPDGWVARMESTDVNTPILSTEIRLFEHEKKIEFVEDVTKQQVTSREAVYFAFPFAMDHPQFQYEIQTGVVDPAKDMYPGAGHEWFSAQHWVSVQQDGLSATVMPLDAGLITLGDIYRGQWPDHFSDRTGTIFSYVMNNYWSTNYEAGQGGHVRFRYVVTSAPSTQPARLSRIGWDESTPLESDEVTRQDKALNLPRRLDGAQGSFLDVQDQDLLVESWKSAENGVGTILRFLDLGGAERTITVRTPLLDLSSVVQTDSVERDQQALPLSGTHGFSFTVHPHEIVTVRMVGTTTANAPNSTAIEKADKPALSEGEKPHPIASTETTDVPVISRHVGISDDSQTMRRSSHLEASPIHPAKNETLKLSKLDSHTS